MVLGQRWTASRSGAEPRSEEIVPNSYLCWSIQNDLPVLILPFTPTPALELREGFYWFIFPLETVPRWDRAATPTEVGREIPKRLCSLAVGDESPGVDLWPWLQKVVLGRSGERETHIPAGENLPSWVHGPGSVKFQKKLALQPSIPGSLPAILAAHKPD